MVDIGNAEEELNATFFRAKEEKIVSNYYYFGI
jgi:hypothetical protein